MSESFALDDKYTRAQGTILLSGVQALVRLPLDQHRADRARGLNTAGLISGYRGSPLAGLDLLLQQSRRLLDEHQISFVPGVNEDLGATMVFGSQVANLFPRPKYDGVIGMWYGKAPGVDRSGDAFKHGNFAGAGRYGGVLVVAGDDPMSKSSTLPSQSEAALYDALMPVLAPGSVQDVLDFGRLGFELSRYSGLWVGFKLVTTVADQFATAQVAPERLAIALPELVVNGRPWRPTQTATLGSPGSLALEQEIYEGRLEAAKLFAAANRLNRIAVDPPDAWLGIVAAGKTYYELRQALADMGLDEARLARYGVRLLQVGMVFPLEPQVILDFARGLEEILVVEEKRPFLELFIRDILYHRADRPRVVGKQDDQGRALIPAGGELDADRLAPLLARRLEQRVPREAIEGRLKFLRAQAAGPIMPLVAAPARTAYFCSGCPHNRSTVVPEGSLAGGGIGCHGLVLGMNRDTVGLGHMGGEGAQWVGIAPFTDTPHLFQNLGDGTLFHSGSLAIRQAIAAGTNITYKILFNSAVGMTGGQPVDGSIGAPALTRLLEAEGVRRIIVTSDHPEKYDRTTRWAPGVELWHRDRLDEAQRVLREVPGVTALIHDQMCAAELRRRRKRGKAPEPATRVFINEAVCEGCGDCGAKSNCLSVQPVETEFGRKTQIHQSSCNKDYSCLLGDCPAFVTVEPRASGTKNQELRTENRPVAARFSVLGSRFSDKPMKIEDTFPTPTPRFGDTASIYMVGIGGTGVVTVNQILGTAALLDGKHVDGMDQTGLSQKGGQVVSNLKIAPAPLAGSNRVTAGGADCLIGFDILSATNAQNLSRARPDRTVAVVSTSQVPTGAMVASPEVQFPSQDALARSIDRQTRAEANVYLDAIGLAERHFGDHMAANLIVLGAAYQAGLIPVSGAAIERAIALNGVAVQMNTQAFRLGRRAVAEPAWLREQTGARVGAVERQPNLSRAARKLIDSVGAEGELRRLLEIRVPELIAYQSVGYAREYAAFVARVRAAEQAAAPGQTRLSEAVARYLFKLMAYKDEYEVARLHLTSGLDSALAEAFGPDAKIHYHLHPPFLRALGWKKKIKFGKWFDAGYQVLMRAKRLRGTRLDPFGRAEVRQVERALIGEYRELVQRALVGLAPDTYERAVQLAELPDMIRGYEDIKLRNVERFRAAARELAGEAVSA
jgi:indolepyruvate ferredoxin oxidoreductase